MPECTFFSFFKASFWIKTPSAIKAKSWESEFKVRKWKDKIRKIMLKFTKHKSASHLHVKCFFLAFFQERYENVFTANGWSRVTTSVGPRGAPVKMEKCRKISEVPVLRPTEPNGGVCAPSAVCLGGIKGTPSTPTQTNKQDCGQL